MNSKETEKGKVIDINRNDPLAFARVTGGLKESSEKEDSPFSDDRVTDRSDAEFDGNRSRALPWVAGGAAAIALAAVAVLPRSHDAPEPTPVQPSYEDLAQQSAQVPYNPETDELVINGIRVKPKNSNKNNASEAILKDSRVQAYVAENPDESSSITTSAMSVPEAKSYAVVERDIDGDGDKDAVAVPVEK